jgi:tellurite methyltransferase
MGKQREHGGEEADRDVAGDVRALKAEHGSADEAGEANPDGSKQRLSQDAIINDPPASFVSEWAMRSGGGRAIDLAMGRGRHALVLARSGFRTFGVDRSFDAVHSAVARARSDGLVLHGWCADLTAGGLPRDAFDLVVVTRYLQRDLFPAIRRMVRRGGVVLYETFTVQQRRLGCGPTSPAHLLEPDELARHFDGFEVLFYEEVDSPEAVARIVARRPRSAA